MLLVDLVPERCEEVARRVVLRENLLLPANSQIRRVGLVVAVLGRQAREVLAFHLALV